MMDKTLLEESLQKLRQIGVKEIAKQTKISTSRLQDILDLQFEHTQRVHLVGFVQILEREYKLDLSGVLKAYDDYHNNHSAQPEQVEKSVQVQDLSLDTQKQRYDAIDERKKQANSKQKFYITLVSVVIVILLYLVYQNVASKYASSTKDSTQDSATEIQAGEESIQAEKVAQGVSQDSSAESSTPESISVDSGIDSTPDAQSQKIPDTKDSAASPAQSSTLESTSASPDTESRADNTMAITTDIMLWFDIIDLDTNRRKYQGVTSDTYSIKTDNHRWLLAFGHSNFSLTMNGSPFTFPKSNYPLYFIYEPDNGFKKIDPQTYKRLAEQVR